MAYSLKMLLAAVLAVDSVGALRSMHHQLVSGSGGVRGHNVHGQAHLGTQASLTANVNGQGGNQHVNGHGGLGVEGIVGSQANANGTLGLNGASGNYNAILGARSTANVSGDGQLGGCGGNLGGNVSVGPQLGASGGGHLQFEGSEFQVGAKGEVAAGFGSQFNFGLRIQTNPKKW